MWEFLRSLLERHGLAALVFISALAGLGFAVSVLWKRLVEVQATLDKVKGEHEKERTALIREEHAKLLAMREAHEKEVGELRQQMRSEARHFAERIDELQEKRNDEQRDVLRECIEHMGATRASVDKITTSMETLRVIVDRR